MGRTSLNDLEYSFGPLKIVNQIQTIRLMKQNCRKVSRRVWKWWQRLRNTSERGQSPIHKSIRKSRKGIYRNYDISNGNMRKRGMDRCGAFLY